MNFQQLRSVREAARRGFNLTEVAQHLHTSQPGVSRQIRELEDELGIEIFVRAGKRLTGLTQPGAAVLPWVEQLLQDAESLHRASQEFTQGTAGVLSVAATHSQARYALPTAVRDFRQTHPHVQLRLHQGSPDQIAQMLLTGEADIGIASHRLAERSELVALPCYRWTHAIVAPEAHPLLGEGPITLERLAQYPIITYDVGLTGRGSIDDAFARAGLRPQIILSAMDADVIKTYVDLGLGVGILASIAMDEDTHPRLKSVDARSLFPINTTSVAVRRGGLLRGFAYEFIQTFASHLTRQVVEAAQRAPADTEQAPL